MVGPSHFLMRLIPGFRDGGTVSAALRIAAKETNSAPTEAQKKAGNYAKGRVRFAGLDIAIENPKGSLRRGRDKSGKPWSCRQPAHYGYFSRTEGKDGDHVDCYIGDRPDNETVWVIDQVDASTGRFDEHKVMLGFPTREAALEAYRDAFSDGKGKDRIGHVTEMGVEKFKAWLLKGDTTKPLRGKYADGGEVQGRWGMPLLRGKKNVGHNIEEMMHADHPRDQSIAAALSVARRRAGGGRSGYADGGDPEMLPTLTGFENDRDRQLRRAVELAGRGIDWGSERSLTSGLPSEQPITDTLGGPDWLGPTESFMRTFARESTGIPAAMRSGEAFAEGEPGRGAVNAAMAVAPVLMGPATNLVGRALTSQPARELGRHVARNAPAYGVTAAAGTTLATSGEAGDRADTIPSRFVPMPRDEFFRQYRERRVSPQEAATNAERSVRESQAYRELVGEGMHSRADRMIREAMARAVKLAQEADTPAAREAEEKRLQGDYDKYRTELATALKDYQTALQTEEARRGNLSTRELWGENAQFIPAVTIPLAILAGGALRGVALRNWNRQIGEVDRRWGDAVQRAAAAQPGTPAFHRAMVEAQEQMALFEKLVREGKHVGFGRVTGAGASIGFVQGTLPEEVDLAKAALGSPLWDKLKKEVLDQPGTYAFRTGLSTLLGALAAHMGTIGPNASPLNRGAPTGWSAETRGLQRLADETPTALPTSPSTPTSPPAAGTAMLPSPAATAPPPPPSISSLELSPSPQAAPPRRLADRVRQAHEDSPPVPTGQVETPLSSRPHEPGVTVYRRGNKLLYLDAGNRWRTGRLEADGSIVTGRGSGGNRWFRAPDPASWERIRQDGGTIPATLSGGRGPRMQERRNGGALALARRYASGGIVVGPVLGETGGREDAKPVDVEGGAYVIPADVVAACGDGNTLAGHKVIERVFGPAGASRASGGAVPIRISDGEHVLTREQVAAQGRGNHDQGCRVLDQWVKSTRARNIKHLKGLPGPAKG